MLHNGKLALRFNACVLALGAPLQGERRVNGRLRYSVSTFIGSYQATIFGNTRNIRNNLSESNNSSYLTMKNSMRRPFSHGTSSGRAERSSASDYSTFVEITTRWSDNDAYGHVNNVIYNSWMDSAINKVLIDRGALCLKSSPAIGFVVNSNMTFFAPISYPETVTAGVKVCKIGKSSVVYEVGIFKNGSALCAARGGMTHVFVTRDTQAPVLQLPPQLHSTLQQLMMK